MFWKLFVGAWYRQFHYISVNLMVICLSRIDSVTTFFFILKKQLYYRYKLQYYDFRNFTESYIIILDKWVGIIQVYFETNQTFILFIAVVFEVLILIYLMVFDHCMSSFKHLIVCFLKINISFKIHDNFIAALLLCSWHYNLVIHFLSYQKLILLIGFNFWVLKQNYEPKSSIEMMRK